MRGEFPMIPKIIHYCWFGRNPFPELEQKCMESWKKYCPDYKIIEWNEDNFDIHCCKFAEEAYEEKKWAFVSDVARLYALVNVGGVYLDTDLELLRPIDTLLENEAVLGFESDTDIMTAFMAGSKGNAIFTGMLHEYERSPFRLPDGGFDMTSNVIKLTDLCSRYGLKRDNSMQKICGATLLPREYLSPKDFATGSITLTENSFSIHHFRVSWHNDELRYFDRKRKKLMRFLPRKAAGYTAKFIAAAKYRGLGAAFGDLSEWRHRRRNK